MRLVTISRTRGADVRQLGSAVLAVVIMLACAALSEEFIPAVASHEPSQPLVSHAAVAEGTVVAANAATVRLVENPGPRESPPRIPEQIVMLIAGVVLIGLGSALRRPRRER
jgi:hypothetical protein